MSMHAVCIRAVYARLLHVKEIQPVAGLTQHTCYPCDLTRDVHTGV